MLDLHASTQAKKWLTDLLASSSHRDGDVTLMWTPKVIEDGVTTGQQLIVCAYPKDSRPASDFHDLFGYRVYVPQWCIDRIRGHKLTLVKKLGGAVGKRLVARKHATRRVVKNDS